MREKEDITMRFINKNIDGVWETFEVTDIEVTKIRERTVKEIEMVTELIKKRFPKVNTTSFLFATLVDKLAPTYGSIFDDYINVKIKKLYKKDR